ncbi:folylpolyglutamate synthase [Puttea exsequens]|nr:folylpolyglutamate synthase [Puttea exsequens]
MIELGLARITRLLKDTPIPWRAIHVAGTNGKGTVCAYASAMLNAGQIRCGRFTSPHLVHRWDCITINEQVVTETLFHDTEALIKARDQRDNVKASEFELLTATAFEIFNREKIDVGIVEVGLGGRYDATNVLDHPAVTVITKIGIDHQTILGKTLEEIAYQKAGIMKRGVPCLVDSSNGQGVLEVLRRNAHVVGAGPLKIVPEQVDDKSLLWEYLPQDHFEEHQKTNLHLAFAAVNEVLTWSTLLPDPFDLLQAVLDVHWPGRLQTMDIEKLVAAKQEILLDGAHNVDSAKVLGSYVDRRLRQGKSPVTWLIAMSRGKNVGEILACLLKPGDLIVPVQFGPVDGMPWVKPEDIPALVDAARTLGAFDYAQSTEGLEKTLHTASVLAKGGPLIVAGSLYLVSDITRLLRNTD